jgi:5-methyltetrahydropteroyltriglutamate--homocysteine methyltransferase
MQRSTERILTTHTGSLVRPREVIAGMRANALSLPDDRDAFQATIRACVADVVRTQVDVGIDIPNDGEFARTGFTSYMHERLGGLTPRALEPGENMRAQQSERALFPEFYAQYDQHARTLWMYSDIPILGTADISANQTEWFRLTGPIT